MREGFGAAFVATNDTDDDVEVSVAVAGASDLFLFADLPPLDVVDFVDTQFQLPARAAGVIVKREWIG